MTTRMPDTPETLTAATTVKGAVVYDLAGEPVGNVDHVMIDTKSGSAIYAVMSFGNSLHNDGKHPSKLSVPWANMKYDARTGSYMVDLDRKVLKDEPNPARDDRSAWPCEDDGSWLAAAAQYQDASVGLL
jgi:sporulation protein YlmC with PRC-barrel domain